MALALLLHPVRYQMLQTQSAVKAARFLRINLVLDIGYMLVGVLLSVFLWVDPFILGNGIGIIIQGAFLFVLDLYFYRKFRNMDISTPSNNRM